MGLFGRDSTTREASVEAWVVLTTLLLLAKFGVGSFGPRISSRRLVAAGVQLLNILNYYSVNYTLGLMRPSSSDNGAATAANDFFQVWAVLIVIMQESVQIGRPYRPRQMTLVDLLSSLWSANLLREQSKMHLKVPLWLMWSIHSLRIVWYFISSNRASEASLDNIKLVSDYMMTSQHTQHDASPSTMSGYKYIVVGEEEQRMLVEPPRFTLEMDLQGPKAGHLLTLQKVWEQAEDTGDALLSAAADGDNRFKDVCLSFALYKLQRRRFFNFPIAEASNPASRRLVSEVITSHERALRVTEVELSFLHDSLYSKHAAVFSGGFPNVRVGLSLLMAAAALYLVYAVRHIPSIAATVTDTGKVARITHGVAITHCIIGIIVCRELMEVGIYILSQWTKVWIVCHHIKLKGHQTGWFTAAWRLITERVARIMFRVVRRGQWNRQIRQYSLLTSALHSNRARNPVPSLVPMLVPTDLSRFFFILRKVKLRTQVETVLFDSLKAILDTPLQLTSYSSNAFGPSLDIESTFSNLEGETHKILIWHIATSLCQIGLLDSLEQRGQQQKAGGAGLYFLPNKPSEFGGEGLMASYVTAVSLSNYCAYLVTQALVPDSGLVATKVFRAVFDEVCNASRGCSTMAEIRANLTTNCPDDNGDTTTTTIVSVAAELSERLASEYPSDEELWERLGRLWAGFLLHLSASTRSAKHKIHLQGRGELTTHLWVLLSHAGFLGPRHGQQMLDPVDLNQA